MESHGPKDMSVRHFPNPLEGRFEDNRRKFTISTDFIFQDGDVRIVVPAGFTTDWNSVPELLWAYFSPWDYPEAGLVHDWLYRSPNGRSRAQCDDVHRRILHLLGCRWSKRQVIWLGIRAGGGFQWSKYRENDPKI